MLWRYYFENGNISNNGMDNEPWESANASWGYLFANKVGDSKPLSVLLLGKEECVEFIFFQDVEAKAVL